MDHTAQFPSSPYGATPKSTAIRLIQMGLWVVCIGCVVWAVWGVGRAGSALHADDWVFAARSSAAPTLPGALAQAYQFCGLHRCLGFAGVTTAMAWADADPAALRLIMLTTHALAALALGWLARQWGASIHEAGLAALLFAVCPSGWNAVTWPATGYAPAAVALALLCLAALTGALGARTSGRRVGLWLVYAALYILAVLTYEAVCGVVLAGMLLGLVGAPGQPGRRIPVRTRVVRCVLAAVPFVLVAGVIAATQPADIQWQPRAGLLQMARTVFSVQYHLLDHLLYVDAAAWFGDGLAEWSGSTAAWAIVVLLGGVTAGLGWRASSARVEPTGRDWVWRAFWGLVLAEAFYSVYVLRGSMDTLSRHRYASVAGLALLLAAAASPVWRAVRRRLVLRAGTAALLACIVVGLAVVARGVTTRYDTGAALEHRMLQRVVAQVGASRPEGLVIVNRSDRARQCRLPEDDMNAAGAGWVLEEYTRYMAGLPALVLAGVVDATTDGFIERRHPERRVARADAAVFVWRDSGVRRLDTGPSVAALTGAFVR
jgi:hypothetical protein